jgi:hypothetical protein
LLLCLPSSNLAISPTSNRRALFGLARPIPRPPRDNSLIPKGITALNRKMKIFVSIMRLPREKFVDSKGVNGFVLQKRGVFNFLGNMYVVVLIIPFVISCRGPSRSSWSRWFLLSQRRRERERTVRPKALEYGNWKMVIGNSKMEKRKWKNGPVSHYSSNLPAPCNPSSVPCPL